MQRIIPGIYSGKPCRRYARFWGIPFGILELDPSTLKADEMKFHVPMDRASEIVPQADLLIITGTTLINDTLEGLLGMKKQGTRVIVVGPPRRACSPGPFSEGGVNILGGVMVTGADEVLDVLAEAGSGYHFFGKWADRIVIEAVR